MIRRSIVKTDETCEVTCINKKTVSRVRKKLGNDRDLDRLAEIFNALADPTRVRMLRALSIEELCVCDLSAVVGMSQSAVSHQLRLLRYTRLVKYRREGKMVFYSLDDDHVRHLIEEGLQHAREDR